MPPAPALIERTALRWSCSPEKRSAVRSRREVGLEGGRLAVQLGGQLGIARLVDELEDREEVVGAGFEAPPQLDLGPQAACLAEDLLGRPLVVPEAGFGCPRL